jgi:hypothetical protein
MKKMNRSDVMKVLRLTVLIVLYIGLTGQSCLEDRCVDLVVGANVTAPFEARGSGNVYSDVVVVDLVNNADIQQVLEDNGFDDMVVAYLESAFYRVTKQDAGASDRTVSGAVTVDGRDLILYQSVAVNDPALANWVPVELQAAGVDYINGLLLTYFTDIFINGNPDPPHPVVTFECGGTSDPQEVPTNFDWEARVKLTLVGKTCLQVIDPL